MYLYDKLPDITSHSLSNNELSLQWVGMDDIAVPLTLDLGDGLKQTLPAKADIYVSLDAPSAKGIHMSRLHLMLNQFADDKLCKSQLDQFLADAVTSQEGISNNARVSLTFDLLLKKPALLSGESGFQNYSMAIRGEGNGTACTYELEITIPYSSTCPCSASLSRQLQAQAIDKQFTSDAIDKASLLQWIQSEQGSIATPHSQRSYAYIKIALGDNPWPEFSSLIYELEEAIGTPVQTAVKRVDEQEFARLNASNLMFCEDAARRIKQSLESMSFASDYWFKVEHQESLHAHNAVVVDQKHTQRTS